MITVYTAGTWDLFHIGHLNILNRSKKFGDRLIVGVSTDKLVKSYKGHFPAVVCKDRASILRACRCVDGVVIQKALLDINQMRKIGVDVITIGTDWKVKCILGLDWAKKQSGIKVVYLPYTSRVSSTSLKEKIRNERFNW